MFSPSLCWGHNTRADSWFVPSQWEMALLRNAVSHWLGASLESALQYCGRTSLIHNTWKANKLTWNQFFICLHGLQLSPEKSQHTNDESSYYVRYIGPVFHSEGFQLASLLCSVGNKDIQGIQRMTTHFGWTTSIKHKKFKSSVECTKLA